MNKNNDRLSDSRKAKKAAALGKSVENTFSEKHYKQKIASKVVLWLTVPYTQAALAIYTAKEIPCYRKWPTLRSLIIKQRDIHRSFKNSSVEGPADSLASNAKG